MDIETNKTGNNTIIVSREEAIAIIKSLSSQMLECEDGESFISGDGSKYKFKVDNVEYTDFTKGFTDEFKNKLKKGIKLDKNTLVIQRARDDFHALFGKG